ncbi:hypothetical protein MC885_002506, partial [Smutsia gigantea]
RHTPGSGSRGRSGEVWASNSSGGRANALSRPGRLLLWLGAAGAILSFSSGSRGPAPSPWYPNVTYPPSGLEPASPLIFPGTEGPWLFSTCGASGRRGPTQTQCDGAHAGSSVVVSVGTTGPLRGV